MNDKEILSPKALRKLDNIIIHHENLLKNKELQQELISWAENMLAEARKEWESMRTVSIDAIISCDRKKEAKRKASLKDEKYAPFCSKRCADIDLGHWFNGDYSVPAEDLDEMETMELYEALEDGNLDDIEEILADTLGLEPDYLDLFLF